MTARTRPRPRSGRASHTRRRKSLFHSVSLNRATVAAVVLGALLIAVALIVVDAGSIASNARDAALDRFGLGIFIIVLWAAAIAIAWRRESYADGLPFFRQAAGMAALGLFAWGALALNDAGWSIGSVDFHEVSLGGQFGQALTSGFLGKLAWISLFIVGMALTAPGLTLAFARNAPLWLQEAWDRRWPHRAASATGRFVAFICSRPARDEAEFVIGSSGSAAPALEDRPIVFRPTIDPASPTSTLGAGAAAHFTSPPLEEPEAAPPTPAAPDPDPDPEPAVADGEPQQLVFTMNEHSGWQLPAIEMLNAPQVSASRKHDNAARAQLIVDTLASFGVDATVVEINEGPTVTQFGVEPGWEVRYKELQLKDESGRALVAADGRTRTERVEVSRTRVRVNKITALQNDLALALAAPSLRIEAPVPGRAIVGIEVPNDSATVVTMRHVMETKEFSDLAVKTKLALALGKGVSGVPVVADLGKMPHLLIAGATGSGKSVCMNAIIAGIMMNATPEQVRFVMVDPKRVELTAYAGIPHMAFSEVIVDMDKVVGTLQAVVGEMEARYKKFASVAVRNIESYNRHPRVLKKLPYWVVIIDELADLMMAAPFEVEKLICRLAQLARATGIHLVVATQRPSVDVVTGLIKANFPTRIAFAVTSMTDSRTILDMGGAEKLLGRGDMLYMPTDAAKPIRIQGVYVSDAEVERLVGFWKDERFRDLVPENADDLLEQALIEQNGGDSAIEIEEDDPIVEKAAALARQHQRVSPSLLQRRLKIGYVKAVRLMDVLEEQGVVGPREEGESRKVIEPSAESGLA
jgi:DNA segregation ATPase FtsK/SpoIIIE, S-DNA-T family